MNALVDCPESACFHKLLTASLEPGERERCEKHLESCTICQALLDQAEEGNDLVRLARRVGNPVSPASDTTLTEVMQRLRGSRGSSRTDSQARVDLYFLGPPERPGDLGTLCDYEVQEVIGQGGMGIVLKAYEPALHRLVAIKVLSPALAGSATARLRFTREAKAAAAVCHDHIVAVHGVHEADGLPYLVMQYVAGESLQDRLDRTGPLDVADIVRIGLQTAQGLAAAHAQGLIHRDIKPANLLLENGLTRVKITDFGLARMTDEVGLTQNGVVAGTPEYMSPEQARAEPIDHRADLFSLGSVLYALCTGVPPFRGNTAMAVLRAVCEQEPAPIRLLNPDMPAWLETLVQRLLTKDPAHRFQQASDVATLLEGYLAHLRQPSTVSAPALPPCPRPGHQKKRRRMFMAGGLAASLLVAFLGWGMAAWLGAGPDEEPLREKVLKEYHNSLKGITEDKQGLELIGPDAEQCVRFEPEGVRITLPANYDGPPGWHGERPDTGLIVDTGIKGDFEITVSFEILQEPTKEDSGFPHTRVSLDVGVDRQRSIVTTLSRRVAKWDGTAFLAWVSLWEEETGKHDRKHQSFRTPAQIGRLRMVRTGSRMSYYAAEGLDGPFVLLIEYPFSVEELQDVRIVASTGGPKAAFDVRLTDLHIRAESMQTTDMANPGVAEGNASVALVVATALVIALALGVVLAVWRTRRAAKPAPAPAEPKPSEPEAGPTTFFCACENCKKKLKVKSALVGKRVKCPHCGNPVFVAAAAP